MCSLEEGKAPLLLCSLKFLEGDANLYLCLFTTVVDINIATICSSGFLLQRLACSKNSLRD